MEVNPNPSDSIKVWGEKYTSIIKKEEAYNKINAGNSYLDEKIKEVTELLLKPDENRDQLHRIAHTFTKELKRPELKLTIGEIEEAGIKPIELEPSQKKTIELSEMLKPYR